jgi:hypothetical protein
MRMFQQQSAHRCEWPAVPTKGWSRPSLSAQNNHGGPDRSTRPCIAETSAYNPRMAYLKPILAGLCASALVYLCFLTWLHSKAASLAEEQGRSGWIAIAGSQAHVLHAPASGCSQSSHLGWGSSCFAMLRVSRYECISVRQRVFGGEHDSCQCD